MSLTDKAQRIVERGLAAFKNMRVRPEHGHTRITETMADNNVGRFQFGCVVGAIAYEAAMLQGLSNAKAEAYDDDSARKWVTRLFGVTDTEVREIEAGFDRYFEAQGYQGEEKEMAEKAIDEGPEMVQVGWHVAKRATKFYTDRDTAEDEAWAKHRDLGLADYRPRKRWTWGSHSVPEEADGVGLWTNEEIDERVANFRAQIEEECEGEGCPEEVRQLA